MITCTVDEHVSLDFATTYPAPDVREKAAAAVKAAQLLMSEGYDGEQNTPNELRPQMNETLSALATGKSADISTSIITPAGAVYVKSILDEYDHQVISDAQTLRRYITNRLIIESDGPDSKSRLRALELLGKISDVALFTERSEVTVTNKSTKELEDTLRMKLQKLMGQPVNEEPIEDAVVLEPPIELDEPLDAQELDDL